MQVDKFNQNLFCSLLPTVLYFSLVAFSRKYKFFWKTFFAAILFFLLITQTRFFVAPVAAGEEGAGSSREIRLGS